MATEGRTKITRKQAEKPKMGRPGTYDPKRYPNIAAAMMRRGMTMEELAAVFSVSKPTVYEWIKKDENFANAIKEGADIANSTIESSLYFMAQEHTVTETKKIFRKNKDTGEPEQIGSEITTKVVPANFVAAAMWLCNRMKDHWKRNPDVGGGESNQIDPIMKLLEQAKDRTAYRDEEDA